MRSTRPRSTSPLLPDSPARALLAASRIDADFKRAALDVVQRLRTKQGSSRKRSRLSADAVLQRIEEEQPSEAQRKVSIHVLLLPSDEASIEAQDDLLEGMAVLGVKVHIHPVLASTVSRPSFSSASALRLALLQAFADDGPYQPILQDELASAGFVFGPSEPIEGSEACRTFLEILAQHSETAFPNLKTPLTITLYIPPRPTSSDFDLDLPAEEVLSLRLANAAADDFKLATTTASSTFRPRLSWQSTSSSGSSDDKRASFSAFLTPSPPATAEEKRARRVSGTPFSAFLSPTAPTTVAQPSLKPLVLRPAPSPVQSVSVRLSLDCSDVLFRCVENYTPVDAAGNRFQLPPPSPAPSPPSTSSSSPSSEEQSPAPSRHPSILIPGPRHQPLTKQPLARSGTLSTKLSEFASDPRLGMLRGLLQQRQERAEQQIAV
ncbi:hypothetical protein JCM10207_001019 [Rhodosporidiobolus poonsookiae]